MRYTLLILTLFAFTSSHAQQLPLHELRALFIKASESQKACKQLLSLCGEYQRTSSALQQGYMASANMIMAKHLNNPLAKWNSFQKGKSLLEKAIASSPHQIELVFLRYSMQINTPAFLNYKKSIQSDRALLSKQVDHLNDPELKKIIQTYLARNSE